MTTKLDEHTWVLVTDSEKALFLENVGDEKHAHFKVRRVEEKENPPTREQGAHKPGRFNDGPSVQRSAVGDTDWHALEKERYADHIAEMLYDRVHSGRIRKLVIVAGPKVLGMLRDSIHQEVADSVVAEIGKNITNLPLDEIEKMVSDELASD